MSNQYNSVLVSQMGAPLSEDRNEELLSLVKAGDAEAREAMITGNMPLALSKVEAFINCFPNVAYLRDDLASAGFMGLTKAVNSIAAGTQVDNIYNYILTAVARELGEAIDSEHPIHVPGKSRRAAKANGTPLTLPVCGNAIPERYGDASGIEEVELRDLLDSCCICEEERTFVKMREARHTYAEIAAAIDMPISSTHVMVRELEARFQQKLEATR